MGHGHFEGLLIESWNQEVRESPMLRLSRKLKRLKIVLVAFNKEHYSIISSRVAQAILELERIQSLCANSPCDLLLHNQEKNQCTKFVDLCYAEKSFKK